MDGKGGVDIPISHQFKHPILLLLFHKTIPLYMFDLPLAWGQFYSGSHLGTWKHNFIHYANNICLGKSVICWCVGFLSLRLGDVIWHTFWKRGRLIRDNMRHKNQLRWCFLYLFFVFNVAVTVIETLKYLQYFIYNCFIQPRSFPTLGYTQWVHIFLLIVMFSYFPFI